MVVEEFDDSGVRLNAVLPLAETVAFVFEDEFADGDVFTRLLDDLMGLAHGDARIVFAVEDEQRRTNLSMLLMGEMDSRNSRSVSSEPYSASRSSRRQSPVFSRNVTKLAMPTTSTPAAQSSGYSVSAEAP